MNARSCVPGRSRPRGRRQSTVRASVVSAVAATRRSRAARSKVPTPPIPSAVLRARETSCFRSFLRDSVLSVGLFTRRYPRGSHSCLVFTKKTVGVQAARFTDRRRTVRTSFVRPATKTEFGVPFRQAGLCVPNETARRNGTRAETYPH